MRRGTERSTIVDICWPASCSLAAVLALWTATAAAQTAEQGSVDEIVVTARRRAESIQNVPESIAALDRSQLEQRQIRTDDDLQLAVPGLTVKSSEGSNQLTYSIRGQTVDTFTGSATAVVPYVNDVSFVSAGATSFFDLESVQVLKGPQGTLFGRNATGGAILYSTAKPENEFGGYLEAQGGNYDYVDGTGAINIPIVNDKLAVRFAFDIAQRQGYQENVVYNTALGALEHRFGRLSVSFRPIENLTNLTVFQYGHSGGSGTSPVAYSIYSRDANGNPPLGPNGSVLNTAASDFYNPATFNNLFGPGAWNRFLAANPGILRAQPNAATSGLPGYLAYYRTQPFWTVGTLSGALHDQNNYFATNTTSYVISPDLTLKNILGYVHDWSRDVAGEAGVPYGVLYTENLATGDKGDVYGTKAYSEEFQILGNALGKDLTYIVGAYYQYTRRYTFYPQFFFNAAPSPYGLALNDENRGTDTNYAFYGQGTYDLSNAGLKGLSVTAGVRYSWEDITLLQLPGDSAFSNLPQQDVKFDKPSWEVGLQYQLDRNLMSYVKGRGSWRSGGLNDAGPHRDGDYSSVPPGNKFNPETIKDVEAGVKYSGQLFDQPAHLNVAVYKSWIDDIQRSEFPYYQGAQIALTVNVPSGTVQGVEFDGTVMPASWLTIGVSGAVTDAKYTNGNVLVLGNAYVFGPWADTPKYSGSIYTRIDLPSPRGWGKLSLTGDLYAQSAQYFSNNNATTIPGTELPSYKLVNARLDWRGVLGSQFSLALFARNLANENYYTGGLSQGAGLGINAADVGRPRMYGAEVRVDF